MVEAMSAADPGLLSAGAPAEAAVEEAPRAGGSALHGPALPGKGTTQSEIDRILAGDT